MAGVGVEEAQILLNQFALFICQMRYWWIYQLPLLNDRICIWHKTQDIYAWVSNKFMHTTRSTKHEVKFIKFKPNLFAFIRCTYTIHRLENSASSGRLIIFKRSLNTTFISRVINIFYMLLVHLLYIWVFDRYNVRYSKFVIL